MESEHRVSTLELFFDLVFVFTITQLTVLLADDLTLRGAGRVLLIFTVLFWMYGGYAYLTNQVPPDRPVRRLLILLAMGRSWCAPWPCRRPSGTAGSPSGSATWSS